MDAGEILRRAQLLIEFDRLAEAEELLRTGLAEEPEHPGLLCMLAEVGLRTGDIALAYQVATAAREADPGDGSPATVLLVRVYLAAELPDAAATLARQLVADDPADATGHALVAACLAATGPIGRDRREAIGAIGRVLELASDDADLLLIAARAADRLNDADLVREITAAGLRSDPTHRDLQVLDARYRALTGEKVAALTGVLADDPTHRYARHALAEVVWGTITRLASGVWVYALVLFLVSAFVSPTVLRHLVAPLMLPLIVHWNRLFRRLRKQLPRGYLSKRLWRSPAAASGVALAALAGLSANFAPVLIVVGWNPDGVRLGYYAVIAACLIAGLAHLLVTRGRLRGSDDVELADHLTEQEGSWAVWLFGLTIPIGIAAACYRLARQPGALWFALMLVPIVLAVLAVEANLKTGPQRPTLRAELPTAMATVLFLAGCGWAVTFCGQRAQATEFHYVVGPLSPERMQFPTITPLPRSTWRLPTEIPREPAG